MEAYKLSIKTIDITIDNNPAKWGKSDLTRYVKDKDIVIVGYFFKNVGETTLKLQVNLYIVNKKRLESDDLEITLDMLKDAFTRWLIKLKDDVYCFEFKNPPLYLWIETKDNWMKKLSGKLSRMYNKTYDECFSSLSLVITELYAKETIYLGNLYYIIVSAHNQLRLEYRYMLNRLHGGHPDAVHLDATFSELGAANGLDGEDGITSLHEVVGGVEDPIHADEKMYDRMDKLIADLKEDFSPREIDQIVNQPGFLPMSLYRRLLKWRKIHKMEDYL